MKKCPYCAEEIQDEAIRCKHCWNDLTEPQKPGEEKTTVPHESAGGGEVPELRDRGRESGANEEQKENNLNSIMSVILSVILVLLELYCLLIYSDVINKFLSIFSTEQWIQIAMLIVVSFYAACTYMLVRDSWRPLASFWFEQAPQIKPEINLSAFGSLTLHDKVEEINSEQRKTIILFVQNYSNVPLCFWIELNPRIRTVKYIPYDGEFYDGKKERGLQPRGLWKGGGFSINKIVDKYNESAPKGDEPLKGKELFFDVKFYYNNKNKKPKKPQFEIEYYFDFTREIISTE